MVKFGNLRKAIYMAVNSNLTVYQRDTRKYKVDNKMDKIYTVLLYCLLIYVKRLLYVGWKSVNMVKSSQQSAYQWEDYYINIDCTRA